MSFCFIKLSFNMNNIFPRPASQFLIWTSSLLFALGMVGCGGGGGGDSDDGEPTVRPKTMDGIVLTLDNAASLEFIRSTGTGSAVRNGDVETGTFIYTPRVANDAIRQYDNLNGDTSNFRYPLSVSAATYAYRAINDSAGVLTLTAVGNHDVFFTIPPGANISLNDSWIRLFFTASPQFGGLTTRVAEIAITFTGNGAFVSSNLVTLRLPESRSVNTIDTVRIPTTLSLANFTAVPENYNPPTSERTPSKIAPASLSGRLMSATNGIPDATKDFTLQFVSDAVVVDPAADSQEIGRAILFVFDPALVPPGLTPVGIALDYVWRRIPGTDRGELVLSNIPDNPALPFDVSLNGTLILSFTGRETGTYTGVADADTPDAAEVSGTFFVPESAAPGAPN
jgi:hypothetical protein